MGQVTSYCRMFYCVGILDRFTNEVQYINAVDWERWILYRAPGQKARLFTAMEVKKLELIMKGQCLLYCLIPLYNDIGLKNAEYCSNEDN